MEGRLMDEPEGEKPKPLFAITFGMLMYKAYSVHEAVLLEARFQDARKGLKTGRATPILRFTWLDYERKDFSKPIRRT